MFSKDMLIGGLAGVFSRTLTGSMELNKIQKQNYFMKNASIKNVIQKEGIRYLWKGNGANVLRIFPQMSINYAVYKKINLTIHKSNISTLINKDFLNFSSGAISGITAYVLYLSI